MQEMPDFKDPLKEQEWPLAMAACDAFPRHTLEFLSAPDDADRTVVAPDFVFIDKKSGERWNVEVKRLVSPHIRRQYAFASRLLSKELDEVVPGLYTCEMRLDSLDPTTQLSLPELEAVIV